MKLVLAVVLMFAGFSAEDGMLVMGEVIIDDTCPPEDDCPGFPPSELSGPRL